MVDVAIIGSGVIGLALAWELAQRGKRVRLLDRGLPGRESSWAGAGILPPANARTAVHPYDKLRAVSLELYPQWSERLARETNIDIGYRRCGGVYVARLPGEGAALRGWARLLKTEEIEVEELSPRKLGEVEPGLAWLSTSAELRGACFVPGEAQVRNPRLLAALLAACERTGVEISPQTAATSWVHSPARVTGLQTSAGLIEARQFCVTGGAWTKDLLAPLGVSLRMAPIRGQMVLFRCEKPPLVRVVNEGSRYLVPRDDGHVLAGSTEEEVGFNSSTTPAIVNELTEFARSLVPALREAPVEKSWAGLRPGTHDGLPYLGRVSPFENLFVAAGHFRSGIYLAPATAVVMAELLTGKTPRVELAPFSVARG